jgi:hypothetical protein
MHKTIENLDRLTTWENNGNRYHNDSRYDKNSDENCNQTSSWLLETGSCIGKKSGMIQLRRVCNT